MPKFLVALVSGAVAGMIGFLLGALFTLAMSKVVLHYLMSFVCLEALLGVAFLIAKVGLKWRADLSNAKLRLGVFLVGTGMIVGATLGRVGWDIQTWGGDSPAEKLDNVIFWTCSLIGVFLLGLDYCLGFLEKR